MSKSVFVDTSAFYALMDRSDDCHPDAADLWKRLLETDCHLQTSNYIVVETMALLQHRLGFDAANLWRSNILDMVDVYLIDEAAHDRSFELWISMRQRNLSMVDCSSFVVMRQQKTETAFTFDDDFFKQGFTRP